MALIERTTIPQLELFAATIGARLWYAVKSALNFKEAKIFFFWSDSTMLA